MTIMRAVVFVAAMTVVVQAFRPAVTGVVQAFIPRPARDALSLSKGRPAVAGVVQAARPAVTPTFARDVAPIVYEHCAVCHRPGQAAPFPLLSYDDVKKRGELIVKVTARRYMPPWHANAAP